MTNFFKAPDESVVFAIGTPVLWRDFAHGKRKPGTIENMGVCPDGSWLYLVKFTDGTYSKPLHRKDLLPDYSRDKP